MATLTSNYLFGLSGAYRVSSDLTSPVEPIALRMYKQLNNGTGNNQANTFWSDTRSVAGGTETLTLTSLTDKFGNALVFTAIKVLVIYNKSTTAGETLAITGNFVTTTLALTGGLVIQPSGIVAATGPLAGYIVTLTSADKITVNPGAATIAYDIALIGVV